MTKNLTPKSKTEWPEEKIISALPKDEIREKIDQDLADRILLNKYFQIDVFTMRDIVLEKQWGEEYEDNFLFTKKLGMMEDILYHERGHKYQQNMSPELFLGEFFPEDAEIEIKKDVFKIMRKYKLPFHFYTWLVEFIDTGKKPKIVPNGWWYKLGRIENYLEENTGITTNEKKQFKKDVREYIQILESKNINPKIIKAYKDFEVYLIGKLKSSKGSSHRKKKLNTKEIERQIGLLGKEYDKDADKDYKPLLHNSKTIGLENFDSGYDKADKEEPDPKDLKRFANRFRKMKSNLNKNPLT